MRVEELAADMEAAPVPLVWRASLPGRGAAVGWCAVFVAFVNRPAGGVLTDPQPGSLVFSALTSVVAAWVCCRLGMWRVAADREGVHVRRFRAVRCIPWSAIGHVELRRDGFLGFSGPETEALAGSFLPPWANRLLRRTSHGTHVADTLTVLARHPELRPQARQSVL
ncbi:PH domain-containing protein [Streptomyces xantholiticus]|uniref:PH domain-containing protein n=1 Tax=Streptomyces xantholiticus TaxID=68285 RepID=A0ABV1V661_9ACTN